jgi:hypothetical protein
MHALVIPVDDRATRHFRKDYLEVLRSAKA